MYGSHARFGRRSIAASDDVRHRMRKACQIEHLTGVRRAGRCEIQLVNATCCAAESFDWARKICGKKKHSVPALIASGSPNSAWATGPPRRTIERSSTSSTMSDPTCINFGIAN
jgi:hypothetical protein